MLAVLMVHCVIKVAVIIITIYILTIAYDDDDSGGSTLDSSDFA